MSELINPDYSKSIGNVCFKLYNKFNICLPIKDWQFLCENRWFSNTPDREVVEAEFGLYDARKADNSEEVLQCIKNCIADLKDIMGIDVCEQCNELLDSNTSQLLTINENGELIFKEV